MNNSRSMMGMIGRLVQTTVGAGMLISAVVLFVLFGWCRVYVPSGSCVVWTAKSGKPLPPDQELAEPGEKGIQRATNGPGRYFYNPVSWTAEIVPQVEIKAGDPRTWTWVHTAARLPHPMPPQGNVIAGDFPEVGILTRKTGKTPPDNAAIVSLNSPYKGVIREPLTPGVYRINPYEYEVRKAPAFVIPAGFVGVVTNQLGQQPAMVEVPDPSVPVPVGPDGQPGKPATKMIQPLAEGEQRGTLRNALPPGVYFLNPNVVRVKIIEVGYNEFTQMAGSSYNDTIRFPSKSGFDIELGVTVVWGLHPKHAAEVINEFGATDEILEKVIKPQLRSICRNQGSLYEARDFIQGEKREEFQQVLTSALKHVCDGKNIELMLALISTIEVYSREGQHAEGEVDLKTEIQDTFLATERRLTNDKLQETAKKKALLEEAKKKVDVMRESIQAQTRKKVAETLAEGERRAAEIEAEGRLSVAEIERQIATIEAEKVELLGRAAADVEKLRQQAEADGKRILVEALGSGAAYNLYTFARNFQPDSIQLFYSGEGTFWTDLEKVQDAAGARILRDGATGRAKPVDGK